MDLGSDLRSNFGFGSGSDLRSNITGSANSLYMVQEGYMYIIDTSI